MDNTCKDIQPAHDNDDDVSEFKVPIGRAPPRKKKILSEEQYVKTLQDIVERSFFPSLPDLRKKMRMMTEPVVGATPCIQNTPETFETPLIRSFDNEDPQQTVVEVDPKKDLSLDKFMALYTSEDNDNFENIMIESEKKNQTKNAWLFNAAEKHNANYSANLTVPSVEEQTEYKKLAITGTSNQEKDKRPKNVENWNYKIFNSVMYVPEGEELNNTQKAQLAKQNKKEIVYENTRFDENPFNEQLSSSAMLEASAVQAYKNEGKVGIDGKDLRQTPKVNGYSYVRDPSPAPGVDASPFMTWGQVEGTPAQLDGSTTPLLRHKISSGPSYSLPKTSSRDELLLQLTEKAGQTHRDKKAKALSVAKSKLGTPKGSFQRLSSMSPAAKQFLSSKRPSSRSLTASLRASYTPSPYSNSSTPNRIVTPKIPTSSITDNLLNLPKNDNTGLSKRKKASDFF